MYNRNKRRRYFVLGLLMLLFVSFVTPICTTPLQVNVEAATIKLNTTKKTLSVGSTYMLKVKNTKKKIKWSSSKKSVASVNSEGVVKAKKAGQATITAKVGSKKLKCVITVKKSETIEAEQVIKLVNKTRKLGGKKTLKENAYLTAAAKARAWEISMSFSHTRLDGTSCFTAVSSKYNYHFLGENIACGYNTPEAVMDAWMKSDGHRKNILDSDFKEIGVGVYEKNGTKYWVQVFGSQ